MSDADVIAEKDGFRVKLIPDHDFAHEPDVDYPLLRLDRTGYGTTAEHVGGGRDGDDDSRIEQAAAAWGHSSDHGKLEKYLRAFYGATTIKWYGPNQVTDYTYVAYDTAAWRESVGAPENTVSFDEYEAWLNGEVYGWRVEVKTHVYQDRRIHSGNAPFFRAESSEYDSWEEVDSLWGFYGYTWAKQAAEEALETAYAGRFDK